MVLLPSLTLTSRASSSHWVEDVSIFPCNFEAKASRLLENIANVSSLLIVLINKK